MLEVEDNRMREETFDSKYEEQDLESLVTQACRHLHEQIVADVQRKYILRDEHYFQAEIYHSLIPLVNDLDPNLKVTMEYRPEMLSHGHVDITVIDQSEALDQDVLYINVGRRTKSTSDDHFVDRILQMAALSFVAPSIFVLVTDGREMADLRLPNNYVLDKKRKIVFKNTLSEILDVQDDYDYFINKLTNKLNLKEQVPENLKIEHLRSFSFGKREKDRFAITVWKVDTESHENERGGSASTFLTEVSGRDTRRESYKLFNRLRPSPEFEMRGNLMVYLNSELVLRTQNKDDGGGSDKNKV